MAYTQRGQLPDKRVVWLKGQVTSPPFSERARILVGHLLRLLQRGETVPMPDSRPMPVVGPGCHELRIRDVDHSWRLMYYIGQEEVVVLDVWSKKTTQTPDNVIRECGRRLQAYLTAKVKGD